MSSNDRITRDLEARFDAELARAARSLVTEDLPRGVLDPALAPGGGTPGAVRTRRTVPAYAGVAAVLVLLLAAGVALVPGGIPPASPSPSAVPSGVPSPVTSQGPARTPTVPGTFRTTAEIRADLELLRYGCSAGSSVLPIGPSPSVVVLEGAVCAAPADAGPYVLAVVVGEAADRRVVEVIVKGNLTGEDTAAARQAIAPPIAKAAAIAASGQTAANALAAWLLDVVPTLVGSASTSTELAGFSVKVVRGASGGYLLTLRELPAFP